MTKKKLKKLFQAAVAALMLVRLPSYADEWGAGLRWLKRVVRDMPRGSTGIPTQWFLMKSSIGWEEMMLIFGYADDRSICMHLVEIAKAESPDRDFTCLDAN